jgi:tripartite-type tricarboxylate transporter receptor subunit TctC
MPGLTRRLLVFSSALLLLPLAACGERGSSGATSDYPSKTIDLVVPFAPGGATDTFARLVADYASSKGDAKVRVVNKEGAGGVSGTNEVVGAKADGYTLIATAASNTMLNFAMKQDIPYTTDDLTLISRVSLSPLVLIVNANSPYQSAEDLVAAVSKDPSSFRIGTSALGGPSTFGVGQMLLSRDIDPSAARLVVLNGGAPTVTAVAGGQVDFAAQLAPEVLQLIRSGKIRGLAVSSSARVDSLDVPTADEAGIPEFVHQSVSGIAGPAQLPEEVVAFWEKLMKSATSDPDFVSKLAEIGSTPAHQGSAEYTAWNTEQIKIASDVAARMRIAK